MADPVSLSSLFASFVTAAEGAAGAVGIGGPTAGTVGTSVAASNVAVGGLTAIEAASIPAAGVSAGSGGLTLLEAAQYGAVAASVGSTANALLSKAPKPGVPQLPSRDTAREEADRLSSLYRKRGRSAALLTPGGAAGDVSSPNLGTASLLGA